ncbi:(2Fe-2S) ferredoxin domain-containing protein [Alkalibaculum sp. M08DMB]|uniref:(2Fe-2S) ferredoxin domain-containing protein n=1 Tax=Alkalibaculum sporogenes TaxID=2655001 RepID=A0A6A7K665_9FIRM|nr:(2Fe-2S) ferredoxin domain-containing protein [Alkalibaculum sporogenes]MPW24831.1 (2Fe-2S) ferredoxin domain-containing protein [Alkalibaculum sporogenes]
MKKSIQELEAIRNKTIDHINLRSGKGGYRVVVGMATCGIAAGARPVMMRLMEEVQKNSLVDVTIAQTGCIGACRLEPIIEVYSPDGSKVTYIKMDEEKAIKVVADHLINGKIVNEYTATTIDGKVVDPEMQ